MRDRGEKMGQTRDFSDGRLNTCWDQSPLSRRLVFADVDMWNVFKLADAHMHSTRSLLMAKEEMDVKTRFTVSGGKQS